MKDGSEEAGGQVAKASVPWKEWLLLFVSAPAALGFLGKIDDRVSFGPLLTRLILNYKEVSRAIWRDVTQYVPWLVDIDHELLSFIALILVPSVPYMFLRLRLRQRDVYWFFLSELSVVIIAISFSIELGFLVLLSIFTVAFAQRIRIMSLRIRYDEIKWHTYEDTFYAVAVFSLVVFSINTIAGWGAFNMGSIQLSVLVLVFVFIHIANFAGMRSPAYILLVAFGVFCFDWLASALMPALEKWLDAAGA